MEVKLIKFQSTHEGTSTKSKFLKDKVDEIKEKEKKKILEKYRKLTGINLEQKENLKQNLFTK